MYRMAWTDERLQERFDSIDRRFDEVDRRFDKVDRRFDKVDGELKALDAKIDGLQRTLMATGGGIIAALVVGVVTLLATQL